MTDHLARLRAAHRFGTRDERPGDAKATHEIHHNGMTCFPGCPAWGGSNRQDEDGTPYLAYFRNDLTMGFIWDGHVDHPVQVQREMGEPVIATFVIALPDGLDAAQILQRFQNACDAFVQVRLNSDYHQED
jgi:hypothetical protein